MSVKLHVSSGINFRKDLYNSSNKEPWLKEVGAELERRNVTLELGPAGETRLENAADVTALFERFKADPTGVSAEIGLPEGRELSEFFRDLTQALDDVVRPTSHTASGSVVDMSTGSEFNKVLGMDDPSVRYASGRSEFGQQPEGVMSVLGVRLTKLEPTDRLEGHLFMDSTTFVSAPNSTTSALRRNGVEFETVRSLEGDINGNQIVDLARAELNNGRRAIDRMKAPTGSEAFLIGNVPVNEVDWGARAHRTRQGMPFLGVRVSTIRGRDRIEWDDDDREHEISTSTDIFVDTYFRGVDLTNPDSDLLLDNGISARARYRYNRPGELGRYLMQMKMDEPDTLGLDGQLGAGMKAMAKQDIRLNRLNDPSLRPDLSEAMMTGIVPDDIRFDQVSPGETNAPVHTIYSELQERGKLPDVGSHEDVLILEPGAMIFSERSRYHLTHISTRQLQDILSSTFGAVKDVHAYLEESTGLDAAVKERLSTTAFKLFENRASTLLPGIAEELAALDPTISSADEIDEAYVNNYLPGTPFRGGDRKSQSLVRGAIARELKASLDALAGEIDDLRGDIAGTDDGVASEMEVVDDFVDFAKLANPAFERQSTYGVFIAMLDEKLTVVDDPQTRIWIDKVAAHLRDESDEPFLAEALARDDATGSGVLTETTAALKGLRANLVSEELEILHRMLEAAGTAGNQLWFADATQLYVGANQSESTDLFIDTFDYVQNISPKDWESLSAEQQDGREPIPADKIFDAAIKAEVQIELGQEEPFLDAIKNAQGQLDGARRNIVLDFAVSNGFGVDPNDANTFGGAADAFGALSDDEALTFVDDLNAFAESKGTPLRFSVEDVAGIDADFMAIGSTGTDYTAHAPLVKDAEMTGFIWEQYLGGQSYVADLRSRRVLQTADRAGVDGLEWNETTVSKGETALRGVPRD